MKMLVVGGAGFIGSHLCDALIEEGNEVICIDNLSAGAKENVAHLISNDRFSFYKINASDIDELDKIFEQIIPDYVFHLAANSDIQASADNPKVEYENTYTTTFNLLLCMRKYNVKKMFFASTSAVYGDKRNIVLDENTSNLMPISYYGASKLGSEALISAFSYMNDMKVLVFRFPNVIGPRLTHGVIFDFIKKLKDNPQKLQILGDGRQTKPYIYISDLVDAIMTFKENVTENVLLYNVGVNGATSVSTIADITCQEMNLTDVQYEYTGGEGGWKGDVPRFEYCLDKIHKAGWQAKYTSDDAVRMTVRENI